MSHTGNFGITLEDMNGFVQNTVPSETIEIGGALVFGLETAAISRPPWIKSVSGLDMVEDRVTNLPCTSFQHLSKRQSILAR